MVRAVDVSPVLKCMPPTLNTNPPRLASLEARRASVSTDPSASLLASSEEHATEIYLIRRQSSMPLMSLSKSLPPTPPTPPSPSYKTPNAYFNYNPPKSPLRDTFVGAESKPHKAIFHVADGSDREEDDTPWAESPQDLEAVDEGLGSAIQDEMFTDDILVDNMRRYHALTELLTTEVGYVRDLRELINVSMSTSPFGSLLMMSIVLHPSTANAKLSVR